MKKKKILSILLCAVLIFAMVACNKENARDTSPDASSSPESSAPSGESSAPPSTSVSVAPPPSNPGTSEAPPAAPERDTVNIAISSDQGTLDSVFHGPTDYFRILCCIQETLWEILDDGTIEWVLATGYDVISDTQWIVHLREGVTFSNGNPFTAQDVVFSFKYLRDSGSMWGPAKTPSVDIDNWVVIDDYTLDMRMPGFHVEHPLLISDILIYDEESFDPEEASINPIGTGPYVLTDYVVNSYCTLERRDDYWGGMPKTKTLKFRVLAEPSQVINALETGMIDVCIVATQDYEYVNNMPGMSVFGRYAPNWSSIGYNHEEPSIFQNVDARHAICYAINKEAIINLVYDGMARPMTYPNSIVNFDYEERFSYSHPTYSIGYDLDVAREYAEKAGLVGQEVVLMTAGSSTDVMLAEILQSMLSEIGIIVTIHNYDGAGFDAAGRDPTAWDMRLMTGICPVHVTVSPLVNGVRYVPQRQTGWEGADFLMENGLRAQTDPDPEVRSELTWQIIQVYQEGCLDYAIAEIQQLVAHSSDLAGLRFKATMGLRFQDLYFAS